MPQKTKISANFQQAYNSSSCGAYSLTAILDALDFFNFQFGNKSLSPSGTVPLNIEENPFNESEVKKALIQNDSPITSITKKIEKEIRRRMETLNRSTTISKNTFLKGFGDEIYKVTGSPDFGCTNFPSSVLMVAKKLGVKNITMSVVKTETRSDICNSMGASLLKRFWLTIINIITFNRIESYLGHLCNESLFNVELEMCRRVIGDKNIRIVDRFEDYEEPKDNECQQALVMIKSDYEKDALHWVAKDAHGEYFDPIKGTSQNQWKGLLSKEPAIISDKADIITKNTVNCNSPNKAVGIKYEWIGLWFTYSM